MHYIQIINLQVYIINNKHRNILHAFSHSASTSMWYEGDRGRPGLTKNNFDSCIKYRNYFLETRGEEFRQYELQAPILQRRGNL